MEEQSFHKDARFAVLIVNIIIAWGLVWWMTLFGRPGNTLHDSAQSVGFFLVVIWTGTVSAYASSLSKVIEAYAARLNPPK